VKFTGEMQPEITLRDLVNATPYTALQRGLLTVEQAFKLSDATAERSAGGCTIELSEETVAEYHRSNIPMLRWMIDNGYEDARTLVRRAVSIPPKILFSKPTSLINLFALPNRSEPHAQQHGEKVPPQISFCPS
jgi:aconitase B